MPDSSFLDATRGSYDVLASSYLDRLDPDLDLPPLSQALHRTFAELVKAQGGGPVADVGCGPGWVTDILHGLGLDVFGIDLSPGMVAEARRTYPGLRFEVGSMLSLDLEDATLGGLLASYSIIHIPRDRLPEVFAEFHRVLAPGGQLMLTFQVGDESLHFDEAWGKSVSLDFYRQQPSDVVGLLREAGFEVTAEIVRHPEPTEKSPHGCVMARKPLPGGPGEAA
ncbi:class I SAM-dependent methyltransferase [Streptomyces sodiiphilus]|uniref:Class I SAM-dependent methyltransferase n=1 Tax=Streptomyces sodiiphilus TaxID=226217 RepID=A0ABP5AA95_9ACTN